MQADVQAVALSGSSCLGGGPGALNRRGGVSANGMPRNLSTLAVAEGSKVVVPKTTPESRVTDGLSKHWTAENRRWESVSMARKDIVVERVAGLGTSIHYECNHVGTFITYIHPGDEPTSVDLYFACG